MNINVAFGKEAGGQYHLSFNPTDKEHVQSGMLVAHVWNMGDWTDKAQRALELYARDRAANNECFIGSQNLVEICDDLASLWQDIEFLKGSVNKIMDKNKDVLDHMMDVCQRYSDMQQFLQPILWTDLPRSTMRPSVPCVEVA